MSEPSLVAINSVTQNNLCSYTETESVCETLRLGLNSTGAGIKNRHHLSSVLACNQQCRFVCVCVCVCMSVFSVPASLLIEPDTCNKLNRLQRSQGD